MASSKDRQYPVHLNPFGSSDEDEDKPEQFGQPSAVTKTSNHAASITTTTCEYPNYLSPFAEDEEEDGDLKDKQPDNKSEHNKESQLSLDNYDESLNPFGEDDDDEQDHQEGPKDNESSDDINKILDSCELSASNVYVNPFEGEEDDEEIKEEQKDNLSPSSLNMTGPKFIGVHQDSLEVPPVPLPRTKSLLKKEKALKERSLREQQLQSNNMDKNHAISLQSIASSASSTSTATATSNAAPVTPVPITEGSLQRKKPKRCAPPVPINYKRQISGSLDAIESELNEIGDNLASLEKDFHECEENLKKTDRIDEAEFNRHKEMFIATVKRRSSIVRRQKELMYRKRELKLDQIHSDIEYELRMIGNKQVSARTEEDKIREGELLKRLVEIVEEKNDIVENLNKDTSCSSYDIEEAFRRLNIQTDLAEYLDKKEDDERSKNAKVQNGTCDRSNFPFPSSTKLSKIATLLPKGGTFKSTMKLKRKHLFKKDGQRSIER